MKQTTLGIIGATGNVGGELVKILSQYDVAIYALTRNTDKITSQKNKIEARFFDFNNIDTCAFENIKKLFWITPINIGHSQEEKWLDVLKKSTVKHIIQLSSVNPEIFNLDKSENLIQQSGIPYTILRANTFMQNFNYERNSILNENAFYFPGGSGKISFIDIRDIAQSVANILTRDQHNNKIYTLTGNKALDYYQVANLFSDVCKKTIKYVDTYQFPEFETTEQKNNPMRQIFFNAVRNNLFSDIDNSLEEILGKKSRSFIQYVEDYWS